MVFSHILIYCVVRQINAFGCDDGTLEAISYLILLIIDRRKHLSLVPNCMDRVHIKIRWMPFHPSLGFPSSIKIRLNIIISMI